MLILQVLQWVFENSDKDVCDLGDSGDDCLMLLLLVMLQWILVIWDRDVCGLGGCGYDACDSDDFV